MICSYLLKGSLDAVLRTVWGGWWPKGEVGGQCEGYPARNLAMIQVRDDGGLYPNGGSSEHGEECLTLVIF